MKRRKDDQGMKTLEFYREPAWQRLYANHPKTQAEIRWHGLDHRAYNWNPQVDPRWTDDEVKVYAEAYEARQ